MNEKQLAKYVAEIAKDITVSYGSNKGAYLSEEEGKNAAKFYCALFDGIFAKLSDTELLTER